MTYDNKSNVHNQPKSNQPFNKSEKDKGMYVKDPRRVAEPDASKKNRDDDSDESSITEKGRYAKDTRNDSNNNTDNDSGNDSGTDLMKKDRDGSSQYKTHRGEQEVRRK